MWKVMLGKRWIGIIETNFAYALSYWEKRNQITGKKFRLVKVDYNGKPICE